MPPPSPPIFALLLSPWPLSSKDFLNFAQTCMPLTCPKSSYFLSPYLLQSPGQTSPQLSLGFLMIFILTPSLLFQVLFLQHTQAPI